MEQGFEAKVARSTAIVLLLVGLALLVSQLGSVLMLIFAAVLIAALIRMAGAPFRKRGMGEGLSVALGIILVILAIAVVSYLFGDALNNQFREIYGRLPAATQAAREWLSAQPFGGAVTSATPDLQAVAGRALSFAFGALGAVANTVLVLISAIYLAIDPKLYARGVERLFPKRHGPRVAEALAASGVALRKFLVAQFVTMAAVGTLVAVGLAAVGVPSAAALGVIVGAANFIPLIGPFIGAVPGLLIALTQGPQILLYAAIVYFVAQQLEGNVLTPIMQKQAVSIPPALLLFALAGLGTLFGAVGVIVAAPLSVVLYTLVTLLWARDTLGHDVEVPGAERKS